MNNTGVSGGAMYFGNECKNLKLENILIENNTVSNSAGGILISNSGFISLKNIVFFKNIADKIAGGLIL